MNQQEPVIGAERAASQIGRLRARGSRDRCFLYCLLGRTKEASDVTQRMVPTRRRAPNGVDRRTSSVTADHRPDWSTNHRGDIVETDSPANRGSAEIAPCGKVAVTGADGLTTGPLNSFGIDLRPGTRGAVVVEDKRPSGPPSGGLGDQDVAPGLV
jgi:hypothetical protein